MTSLLSIREINPQHVLREQQGRSLFHSLSEPVQRGSRMATVESIPMFEAVVRRYGLIRETFECYVMERYE